ncbi:MAG: hypothetical protein NWE93_08360 [Candidatus Bathyarchaeota archaeon]|nr:hypothetical protein [Candidatus Bathyarchaeota archaeon]
MTKEERMLVALDFINKANDLTASLIEDITANIDKSNLSKDSIEERLYKIEQIAKQLSTFYEKWNESGGEGGYSTLGREVDMTLLLCGNFDRKQLKITMVRITAADVALRGLECIRYHTDDFVNDSKKRKELTCVNKGNSLKELINRIINELEKDSESLKQQCNNASLYYQILMVSRAVKIAYASFAVSSFAFALTILQAIHII